MFSLGFFAEKINYKLGLFVFFFLIFQEWPKKKIYKFIGNFEKEHDSEIKKKNF